MPLKCCLCLFWSQKNVELDLFVSDAVLGQFHLGFIWLNGISNGSPASSIMSSAWTETKSALMSPSWSRSTNHQELLIWTSPDQRNRRWSLLFLDELNYFFCYGPVLSSSSVVRSAVLPLWTGPPFFFWGQVLWCHHATGDSVTHKC